MTETPALLRELHEHGLYRCDLPRMDYPADILLTAADELEIAWSAYRRRTAELQRVMAERDELLAERGIEHHGSDAT